MTRDEPALGRIALAATFVGVLAGLVGAAFHAVLDQADAGRSAARRALEGAAAPGWLVFAVSCALLVVAALWMVRRFAPEAAGSGIQEVEAILAGRRRLHWRPLLPVKFLAGSLAVGSGLVLGREGPTVHMGAAIGQMLSERLALDERRHRWLIASGAAAGLAAAFNAPLAAIVFVTEELREHFEYRIASVHAVILASCASVAVSGWLLGQGPDLPMPDLRMPPLTALPSFLVLGVLVGALGVLFNRLLPAATGSFRALRPGQAYAAAGVAGIFLGTLLWWAPDTVGGGEALVESIPGAGSGLMVLLGLLLIRLLTTIGSYGLGVPGGIFAPLLALGTIAGAAFSDLVALSIPSLALPPGVFAVAAMGALFAATVRAPLTGIILVIELTGAEVLALPIILTCLAATLTAEAMGGRPIYGVLLGLSERPPPRAPLVRILAGATLLATVVTVGRLPVAPGPAQPDPTTLQDPPTRSLPPPPTSLPFGPPAERPATEEPLAEPAAATPPVDRDARSVDRGPVEPARETIPSSRVGAAVSDRNEPTPPTGIDAAMDRPPETATEPPTAADRRAPSSDAPPTGKRIDPGGRDDIYSLQLISFRRPASLAPFARREGLLDRALTLQGGVAGWYPVLVGRFATRAEASAARDALPPELRRLQPLVRAIRPNEQLVPLR